MFRSFHSFNNDYNIKIGCILLMYSQSQTSTSKVKWKKLLSAVTLDFLFQSSKGSKRLCVIKILSYPDQVLWYFPLKGIKDLHVTVLATRWYHC